MPKKSKKSQKQRQKQKQKQSQSVTVNIGSRAGRRSVAAAPPRQSAPINLYTPPTIITTPVFQQQQSEPVNQQVGQRVSTATPAPAAAPATPPTERRFVNPREEIRNRLKAEGAASSSGFRFASPEDSSIASLQEQLRRVDSATTAFPLAEASAVSLADAVRFSRRNFNDRKYRQLLASGKISGEMPYEELSPEQKQQYLEMWLSSPDVQTLKVAGRASKSVTQRKQAAAAAAGGDLANVFLENHDEF